MRHSIFFLLLIFVMALLTAEASAQEFGPGNGEGDNLCRFIDEDGDGFNDLAPDADGDGIPNGLDPDYVKPQDGTGMMNNLVSRYGELFRRYFGDDVFATMNGLGGNHYGPGDGSGVGSGLGDGTGFGPGTGDTPGDGDGSGSQQQNHERRGGRR